MYCSQADILNQLPEAELIALTDDSQNGTVDSAHVESAIIDAGDIIDGFLRSRYPLPVSPVPGLIKTLAVDITIYRLYSRRFGTDMPESITSRYKNALNILDKIQKGVIRLGIETVAAPSEGGLVRTNKSSEDKVFNKDLLSRY